jgi:mono/diheme cytochrome c family protein
MGGGVTVSVRGRRALRLFALAALVATLGGCRGCASSRPPLHLNPNMDRQPKYLPQAESAFFADGATMRRPVEGTVARGELFDDAALWRGVDEAGQPLAASPVAAGDAVLARSRERYGIYCAPCHGDNGKGRGMLFERSGVQSGDMIGDERIRGLSDGELFKVITEGVGLMPGYAYQVPPADRWAIVAHVRVLQGGDGP